MPYKGYGLVRDKNGKPRFDDITVIVPAIWEMLTEPEREQIIEDRRNGNNSFSSNT